MSSIARSKTPDTAVPPAALRYVLDVTGPAARRIAVALEFDAEACSGDRDAIELFLPTWTPGSYLIREFSRHLSRVVAEDVDRGTPLHVRKSAKNRFVVSSAGATRIRVSWTVYAHELSVRTADLTEEHAYWNHACVLLWPVGQPNLTADLAVRHSLTWSVACSLPIVQATDEATARTTTLRGVGLEAVMDAPVLAGALTSFEFEALGVPHRIVCDGLGSVPFPDAVRAAFPAIVREAAAVFAEPLPYRHYAFLCLFAADGHGGLEHGESTTLLMARTALHSEKGRREFLSLAAHELFHAWNVKRLRPREFWNYDYERENYTTLLWLIEGWTAYYDDLLCLRAGVFGREEYLSIVSRNLAAMRAAPGRFQLSLAESSFDAWIRLYRPDENTRNSSQNYYGNGAVAAMCLDLSLRFATGGTKCLDDVLRQLWSRTWQAGRGYDLDDVEAAVAATGGQAVVNALRSWTQGALDPDLGTLLQGVGLRLQAKDAGRPYLGIHFDAGRTTIASVQADGPAQAAGLAPGDEVLALQDLRVDADRWSDVVQAIAVVGAPIEVLYSRRGRIGRLQVTPNASPGTPTVEIDPQAAAPTVALRDAWLPVRPLGAQGSSTAAGE